MKPVAFQDKLFLWLEKRQQPMHIGGLTLLKIPDEAGPNFMEELVESLRQYNKPTFPFNSRLVKKNGRYFWDEDQNFDIDSHLRHIALPKPGRIRELFAYISGEHSHTLDRERPLWRAHIIEGIEDNRFALFMQAHHVLVDGVGAVNKAYRAFSPNPLERGSPPMWAMPETEDSNPTLKNERVPFVESLQRNATYARNVVGKVIETVQEGRDRPDVTELFDAPDTILNQPITGSRRYVAQSYSMARIKHLAKACDSTLNNVIMAVCGSALRAYLQSQDALPEKPLIAMFPYSYRKDRGETGNKIMMLLANLGTHIADPLERLACVAASTQNIKNRVQDMSPVEMIGYTALTIGPTGLNVLTGLGSSLRGFNVVISNIQGPKEDHYWNGAKIDGMYPISIPLNNIALNITLVSYAEQLDFGITACRNTVPSMQRLLDYIENGFSELEQALNIEKPETLEKKTTAKLTDVMKAPEGKALDAAKNTGATNTGATKPTLKTKVEA